MKALTGLFAHETAGMFGVASGILYWLWKEGAPEPLLYCVTVLAAVYIAGEKIVSIWRP